MPRLQKKYKENVVPAIMKDFGIKNINRVPKLKKITLNIGIGDAKVNPKALESSIETLEIITGQKPMVTKARKSISNFKIREGFPVGCSVTLRSDRMWFFLDRLINVVMPRIKDFRGVSHKKTDGRGNFSLGLKEQIVFPEIVYEKIDQVRGMNIAFTTTAQTDEECVSLLKNLGMPFARK
ncbi:MAG: 50S ribosomal protein L5 [Candidatus Muiribacteriaceae bacterium]